MPKISNPQLFNLSRFNAKIKAFRASFRGVRDINFGSSKIIVE